VVLWELLAGRRLFSSDNAGAAVQKLLNAEIELPSKLVPDVPAALDQVVLKALARPSEQRFQSARAMAEALERAVAPCSMLELASWVESLVGEELEARSELVFEVESLDFDEFTRSMPQAAALAQPMGVVPVAALGSALDEDPASQKSLSAVSAHRHGPSRKGWLVPVTAAFALASFVLWGRTRRAPETATAPVIAAHAALPAAPLMLPAPAQQPTLEAAVHAAPTPPPASASPIEKPGLRKAASKPSASARAKPVKDCDVPYVIDKNGVKRFKEVCF
jgi:hypothetical protein